MKTAKDVMTSTGTVLTIPTLINFVNVKVLKGTKLSTPIQVNLNDLDDSDLKELGEAWSKALIERKHSK